MINREELIRILKYSLDREEKSIPIYTKHLESAIFWTGIDEAKAKGLKELLRYLAQESQKHMNIIDKLIQEIQERNQDAF